MILGTNIDFDTWNMNILAMNKRLSILPGSQNHQNNYFLTFQVTNKWKTWKIKNKQIPKVPKNKNVPNAIKTHKTSNKKDAPRCTDHFSYWMDTNGVNFEG